MNISKALKDAFGILSKANIDSARTDAYLLMSFSTSRDKSFLYAHPEYELTKDESELYFKYISRRALNEPVAYIIGNKEFYGLDFFVNESVLIPRPDTELAVDVVLAHIKESEKKQFDMLDLCCGSGCIGISVLKNSDMTSAVFADISGAATEACKRNIEYHNLGSRAEIIKSDMFSALRERKFDIIVSNPPYVTTDEYKNLASDITDYEPTGAFVAGSDGLDFYRIIAADAACHLNESGFVVLEVGCAQAESVSALLADNGFEDISVFKDLAGLDRVVAARKGKLNI